MAADKRKIPGVPAGGGGNRKPFSLSGKVPMAPNFKTTYGVGDGAGGNGVPAGGGGNRKNPAIAGKLPLPTNYDSYQSDIKK
jgi:hypothetical protein